MLKKHTYDWLFLCSLAVITFFAVTTGDLIPVVMMLGLGAMALRQYVWLPMRQRQIQPLVSKAQAARDVGNPREAVALYDRAIAQQPNNIGLYLECGQVKFAEKDYKGALAYFNKAVRLSPKNNAGHLMASLCHCNLKDYRRALAINNEIINSAPNGPNTWLGYVGRGSVFIYMRKFDRAMADYYQAHRLKPNVFFTNLCLAEGFCYMGEFTKGMEAAERAIEQNPSFGTAYLWRGWAKYGVARYEEALKDCNSVIQQDPKNGKAYEIRGLIYQAMGKLEPALTDLEKAQELYRQDGMEQFEADVVEPLVEVRQALNENFTDAE
jgi:tetratricopeptide (TPR) repeat protein